MNVIDFSRKSGISESDIFVLEKQYKSNVFKSSNQWYDILSKNFKIPFDIRVNVVEKEEIVEQETSFIEEDKKDKIVKEIKEKKNNKK